MDLFSRNDGRAKAVAAPCRFLTASAHFRAASAPELGSYRFNRLRMNETGRDLRRKAAIFT